MPTYQYRCKNCDFEFEDTFKMDDRNDPVENPQKYGSCTDESNDNCAIQLVPQLPSLQYTMRDSARRHTDDGFKDRMKEIHRTNPGSQLGDWT
jgi:putative FmdB family regulatory protein